MKARGIRLLIFVVPVVVHANVNAGGRSAIEAVPASHDVLKVNPGGLVKSGIIVSNQCGAQAEIVEEIRTPSDWKIVTPEALGFDLEPGDRMLRLIVLYIPESYPPGDYRIAYHARCRGDPGADDTATFVVRVPHDTRLEATGFSGPKMLIAGGVWRASLELTNKGNSSVDVGLDVRALPKGIVEINPRAGVLRPAETDTFTVLLKTDAGLRQKTRYAVEVTAQYEDAPVAVIPVRRTACVDVVPKVTGTPDPYHRLPTNIQVVSAIESGISQTQAAVSASGSLDEAGERRIGFVARGPDIDDAGRYGKRDEYWLHYEDDSQSLTIGDRTYSLSPLTQRFRYGQGVEIRRRLGSLNLGGLYMETGQHRSRQERIGAQVKYTLSKGLSLRANFLTKTADSTFCGDCRRTRIYSLESSVSKGSFDFNAEYGLSRGDGNTALEDRAYRIESRGQIASKISYSVETIHAGRDFAGYYRGTDNTVARMAFPIFGQLRSSVFYNYLLSRPQNESQSQTADRVQTFRGGLSYQSSDGLQVSIDYLDYRKRDTLLPANYDFAEGTVELGFGRSFGWFALHGRVERGRHRGRLIHLENDDLERYSLSATLRPGTRHSYVVYVRVGHARFSDSPQRELTAGMSVRLAPSGRLRFNIDGVTSRKVKEPSSENHSIMTSATVDLPYGHSLSVRGHVFLKDTGEDESAMYLVYGIPIGVPAGKRKSIGSLRGRLYDEEIAGNVPVSEAVLFTNGAYAVTDENGRFVFPALRPGSHALQIESASLGHNRVTAKKLPVKVEIEGAKTTEIDIGVVTASRLRGSVRLYTFAQNEGFQARYIIEPGSAVGSDDSASSNPHRPELIDAGGARVLVKVTDGDETLHQYTNDKGEFAFERIRPGTWQISLSSEDLPDLYHFESAQFAIILVPGEERQVLARIVPSLRPVRMIDAGLITQGGVAGR